MQEQEKLKFFEVAHEGAFVRAMAEAVANGVFSDLREFAPRSIVAVCGDDASRHAAEIVSALSGPLSIPVVVTDQLPVFCGALDVVLSPSRPGSVQDGVRRHSWKRWPERRRDAVASLSVVRRTSGRMLREV